MLRILLNLGVIICEEGKKEQDLHCLKLAQMLHILLTGKKLFGFKHDLIGSVVTLQGES